MKTINFINRTKKQIYLAFDFLKKKYVEVQFIFKVKNGLLEGYFIVARPRRKWFKNID